MNMAKLNENTFKKVFEGKFQKTVNGYEVKYECITVIKENNPRVDYSRVDAIKQSIMTKGQLEPVKVRLTEIDGEVKLLLVAGYTRMLAFEQLKQEGKCPDYIKVTILFEGSDIEDVVLNYQDNCHRKEYTELERGLAILRLYQLKKAIQEKELDLIDSKLALARGDEKEKLKKQRKEVSNDGLLWESIGKDLSEKVETCRFYLRFVTKLSPETISWVQRGLMSPTTATTLLSKFDEESQSKIIEQIVEEKGLQVSEVEETISDGAGSTTTVTKEKVTDSRGKAITVSGTDVAAFIAAMEGKDLKYNESSKSKNKQPKKESDKAKSKTNTEKAKKLDLREWLLQVASKLNNEQGDLILNLLDWHEAGDSPEVVSDLLNTTAQMDVENDFVVADIREGEEIEPIPTTTTAAELLSGDEEEWDTI